jgi:hypothetical protein
MIRQWPELIVTQHVIILLFGLLHFRGYLWDYFVVVAVVYSLLLAVVWAFLL